MAQAEKNASPLMGITVSDLHLLAERQPLSIWQKAAQEWRENYDLCVLNGDIFDFRWARNHTRQTALLAAEQWLQKLVEPPCRASFVILQGNHDALEEYQRILRRLAEEHAHVYWKEHWFILGHAIFLHGDMPDQSGRFERLEAYRRHHAGLRRPRPFSHRLYATATRLGVTGSMPRVLPWRGQCRRIDALLRNELGKRYDGIFDVYLGHTHVHFRDRQLGDTRFHNAGAPLPRARFDPPVFQYAADDWKKAVAEEDSKG
jgi:predicted phosphodiesterase